MGEINQDPCFSERPLITIVTVVFNGGSYLEKTILSVLNQTYENVEYIIIDGGSTDETVDILRKYKNFIDSWKSEKDRGIYDAMNKGALMANGGYMCFMNAGDVFFSDKTVEQVALRLSNSAYDVLYGDVVASYSYGIKRLIHATNLSQLWKGMCFSHQSMFVKSEIMKMHLYNIDNSIGADYEFICRLYANGSRFTQYNGVVAAISTGGVSDTKRVMSVKGRWCIARSIWPGFRTDLYYRVKLIDAVIRSILHRFLPQRIRGLLTKLKYIGRYDSV